MDDEAVLPITLIFEERPGYLYVRATGMHTNRATAEHSLKLIAARCKELESTRLLIYRDITQVVAIGPMFQVAMQLPAELPGVRTAFVNPHSSNRKNLEFGRDLIAKTGAAIGLFNEEAAAIEWLLKDA